MLEIEKPKIVIEESEDLSKAKFIVEPLERGFGITLGNCLRRLLLSSLPGLAPVGIMIDDVKHEFSTIKGVKEDVVEIILNIKGLALKTSSTEKNFRKAMHLKKSGPCEVYARDFEPDADIEILNPDLYICTIDEEGSLNMQVTVAKGRGYRMAEGNKSDKNPIGFIPVDSIFTPVKKVNYHVESTRVGQSIDFDKLTLEVETNGAFTCREIVSLAAKIMQEHINLFVSLADNINVMDIMVSHEEDKKAQILEMSIEEMDLSVRSYNCLKRANIHTVEDLIKRTEEDMLKVRNLGRKSLDEVINKLKSYGLSLRSKDE
ncbi:MAG: DNA-directed RNA polymerase subunit alpha [Clostridiales bacterium]|nr:DNA-directed RNA polymerase subunit alpha [Clostridiales bacterium]